MDNLILIPGKRVLIAFSILALLAFFIFMSILVAGCGQSFTSNGQKIYLTAKNTSGQSISYTGGPGTMMQGQLACVNCHGPEGHGGAVNFMMQSYDIPNITWPELTADAPPYSEETLKRAITQGIDPAGDPLKYPMPRWQMSDSDLNDLVSFIKTMK